MNEVDKLLRQSRMLWRGAELKRHENTSALSTGFKALDRLLPEKGWPRGALIDFILPHHKQKVLHGIGELRLLLPAMCGLAEHDKWLLWIGPPHVPYAPALQSAGLDLERLVLIEDKISHSNKIWAMEKALRTAGCGMVLCWVDSIPMAASRRLQLAAEQSGATGVLLQTKKVAVSAACLRLKLTPLKNSLLIELTKARGSSRYPSVELKLHGDIL